MPAAREAGKLNFGFGAKAQQSVEQSELHGTPERTRGDGPGEEGLVIRIDQSHKLLEISDNAQSNPRSPAAEASALITPKNQKLQFVSGIATSEPSMDPTTTTQIIKHVASPVSNTTSQNKMMAKYNFLSQYSHMKSSNKCKL